MMGHTAFMATNEFRVADGTSRSSASTTSAILDGMASVVDIMPRPSRLELRCPSLGQTDTEWFRELWQETGADLWYALQLNDKIEHF